MAISPNVSLRIPETLLLEVERIAETDYPSRGEDGRANRSQVILDAIAAYVEGRGGATTSLEERVEQLEQRLAALETSKARKPSKQ
jgi:metal-responsive CopG/Arc/MetJ family transcriptional regulator